MQHKQSLVLGFDEDREVFAAWDARVHPNPGISSSLQVPGDLLDEAANEGFASRHRVTASGQEVIFAFRPEAVGAYLEILPDLPGPDAGTAELRATDRAGRGEEVDIEELPLAPERKEALRRIRIRARDQRFRLRVIDAYESRCAFCGVGAGLVHAAHVQAVGDGGPDLVANGLAACPTHRAAFDRGFMLIDDDYTVRINESRLRQRGISEADIAALAASTTRQLATPARSAPPPAPDYLRAHRDRFS
jgi:putative restriction endonuclease